MSYRRDITGLRALAVLIVVLFHLNVSWMPGGFIGVDVFFVISGYLLTGLITGKLEAGAFSFADFYKRRIRRLFPALFVTVLVSSLAALFILPPTFLIDFAWSAITSLVSATNFLFWSSSGYFDAGAHTKPLLHTWSLSVEEQFYLFWPLLLFLSLKLFRDRKGIFLVLGLVFLLSLAAAELVVRSSPESAFFLLPFRVFEFAAGGMMCFLPAISRKGLTHVLSIAGIAAIGVSAVLFTEMTPVPGLAALIPVLGTCAVLVAGQTSFGGRLLSMPGFEYTGQISYSLYLTHWPIITLYGLSGGSGAHFSIFEQAALFGASFGSAALLHTLVERPFRLGAHKPVMLRGAGPVSVFCAFAASIALLATPLAYIIAERGLPQRYQDREDIEALLQSVHPDNPRPPRANRVPDTAPRIVLMGDSHAGVAQSACRTFAVENNFRTGAKLLAGCAPLLETYTLPADDDCVARVSDELFDVPDGTTLIILQARWGLYTSPTTWSDDPVLRMHRNLSDVTNGPVAQEAESSRKQFMDGLERTFQHFSDLGITVLFVGQVPPIGIDPEICISRLSTPLEVEAACNAKTFDQAEIEARWATRAAANIEGLHVYDPFKSFCGASDDSCRIMTDGKMLYQDDNHLNRTGVDYLFNTGLAAKISELMVADNQRLSQ